MVPHPSLPSLAGQVWLTQKGCLAVSFLLLGGGSAGGAPRSKTLVQGEICVLEALDALQGSWHLKGTLREDETLRYPIP